MERLHILDGHGYIFRAYYAIAGSGASRGSGSGKRLSTADGLPTGALYVFTQMLIRLYLDQKPERIAVVFDAGGKSFRHELDADYKATRRETPDDLKRQLPLFSQITEVLQWPVMRVPGVEADDVIATLTRHARARGWEVVIYSGDKDLMQLVDDGVTVIDSLRQINYDTAAVEKKFGVGPQLLRDYLALVGDSSDNVPGMPGVGKVTASKLLKAHGSIDGILAETDALKGKLKERFTDPDNLAQLQTSRALVTLRSDLDPAEIGKSLDELVPQPWDGPAVRELFTRLEFGSLLKRLEATATDGDAPAEQKGGQMDLAPGVLASGDSGHAGAGAERADAASDSAKGAQSEAAARSQRPLVILQGDSVAAMAEAVTAAKTMAIAVETDGSRPDRARVVGVAVAASGHAPIYIPLTHRYLSVPAQYEQLPSELVKLIEDPEIATWAHDIKSARRGLASIGVTLAGAAGDTMLCAYLLGQSGDIAALAAPDDVAVPTRASVIGTGKARLDFESVAVESAALLAAGTAQAVLTVLPRLRQEVIAQGMGTLLDDVEVPLAVLLADIEGAGIRLDVEYLRALSEQVGTDVAALEQKVHELAGETFNLGSPKQLSEILFDKLGLKAGKMQKTKSGGYSTSHDILESMVEDHDIIAPILEFRELIKLKGTYLDALPPLVNPKTGRIHTSFNQAVAATGRLSSQDPNLQNIPIRKELGRAIRRAFVAAPGKTLVSVDYSQIELRIVAHLAGDEVLKKAFRENIDVHTQTAAEVFSVPLEQVDADKRRVAKAVNYGLIYGQSEFGLAQALGIARSEAKVYMERYFERFATIRTFMDQMVADAREHGYAVTVLGRRRPIPDIGARNYQRRRAAERMAQNTPVQGSAADIMKLAMLRVDALLRRSPWQATMLLTVHDELVFEVDPSEAQDLARAVAGEMEAAYELDVPLVATIGMGQHWAEAH